MRPSPRMGVKVVLPDDPVRKTQAVIILGFAVGLTECSKTPKLASLSGFACTLPAPCVSNCRRPD